MTDHRDGTDDQHRWRPDGAVYGFGATPDQDQDQRPADASPPPSAPASAAGSQPPAGPQVNAGQPEPETSPGRTAEDSGTRPVVPSGWPTPPAVPAAPAWSREEAASGGPAGPAYGGYAGAELPSGQQPGPDAPTTGIPAGAGHPTTGIPAGPSGYGPGQSGYEPGRAAYEPGRAVHEPGQPHYGPTQAAHEPGQTNYGPSQPAYGPGHASYGPGQSAYGAGQAGYGPGQPGDTVYGPAVPIAPRRERRRPGWGGTIAVGAAAAVLASALTAGGMVAFDHRDNNAAVSLTGQSSLPPSVSSGKAAIPASWTGVAEKVAPSVVSVQLAQSNGSGDEGSGIVLDKQGHILTNNHVIADSTSGSSLTVQLADGRIFKATVVGADPSTDLAVLKLAEAPSGLTPATFADSGTVKVGDSVMAIGNPLGLSDTVTTGIVSALNRPISTTTEQQQAPQDPFSGGFGGGQGQSQNQPQSQPVVTNAIQTDAAVNPGNSGGALVDTAGQVIGVTSSIESVGSSQGGQSGSIGLGFAIPSSEARNVAQQLISTGTVKHAYLGVGVQDGTATVGGAQQNAAIVGTVTGSTPAAEAGLKSKDAIIALNGAAVGSADSLVGQIRALSPGTKVNLTVVRDGQSQQVTVTLGTAPATTN